MPMYKCLVCKKNYYLELEKKPLVEICLKCEEKVYKQINQKGGIKK